MRIKLRINPLDLDLLALAQTPEFDFSNTLRDVLLEYVQTGHVPRVFLPDNFLTSVALRTETFDITLTKKYEPIAKWVLGLQRGFRSTAVKAVLRAALPSPVLYPFLEGFPLVKEENETEQEIVQERAPAAKEIRMGSPKAVQEMPPDDDFTILDLVDIY